MDPRPTKFLVKKYAIATICIFYIFGCISFAMMSEQLAGRDMEFLNLDESNYDHTDIEELRGRVESLELRMA